MRLVQLRCGVLCCFAVLLCGRALAWDLEGRPETVEVWGYRPVSQAEGINPPGFTWAPEPHADQYGLQVSDMSDFGRMVFEVKKTRWSSLAPLQSLPVEKPLYWRYRASRGEEGWSAWSAPREFRIARDAPRVPKPDANQLIRRIPVEHPRLFLRPETLDALRERTKGDLAPHWKEALKQAEAVLASPPDTSIPPLYPEEVKKGSEEWKKIWWGNRLRGISLMEGAAKCAFAYRLGGDPRFGQMAHDLMMAFTKWNPKGSTNFEYNDEAAMPLLYWPSRTYTWAYDRFTEKERAKIVEVMRERGTDCYRHLLESNHLWRPFDSHSNRAWHKLAELAIAFQTEIPEAREWLDYTMTVFFTCYPVWGGEDGAWHEGTAYWLTYMERFNYWAVTMKTSLDIDPFAKPYFSQTGYYAMYTLPPGTQAGAWGDLAQGTTSDKAAEFVGFLAAVSGKADWQWYAEQGGFDLASYGWFGLAAASLLPEAPKSEAPLALPSSRVFPETGLAVFNSNLLDGTKNIQVHFKSSSWGRQSHGYNANNAFMLYVHGAPLLTLTGKRDVFGSPHHKEWMWESKSDNAVLVNGVGERRHDAESRGAITRSELAPDVDMVEGDASASFATPVKWVRRLFFFKPDLLLIHDMLEVPEPSTYQWMLHSMGAFEIGENRVSTQYKDANADVAFLYPPALSLTQSDVFDPPPHAWTKFNLQQWHLTAATTDKQAKAEFLVAIRVNGAQTAVSAERQESGFTVKIGGDYELDTRVDAPFALKRLGAGGAAP